MVILKGKVMKDTDLLKATLLDKLYRSRHRRCSMKKGVLKNFPKFTGKHLCQSLVFNKVAGLVLSESRQNS